jgi:anti-anti-sigma factor
MESASRPAKDARTSTFVRTNVANGVVTIYVEGRFDFNCHRDFRRAYEGAGPMNECVVDLSATEYLDSSALGMLLVLREAVGSSRLRITNSRPAVRRILEIANFQSLFSME